MSRGENTNEKTGSSMNLRFFIPLEWSVKFAAAFSKDGQFSTDSRVPSHPLGSKFKLISREYICRNEEVIIDQENAKKS